MFFPFLIFVDSVVCFVVGFQRSVLNRMRGFWVEKPEVNRKFPGSFFPLGVPEVSRRFPRSQITSRTTTEKKNSKRNKGHTNQLTQAPCKSSVSPAPPQPRKMQKSRSKSITLHTVTQPGSQPEVSGRFPRSQKNHKKN